MEGKLALVNTISPNSGGGKYASKLWDALKNQTSNVDFVYIDKLQYSLKKISNPNTEVTIAKTRKIPLIDNRIYLAYRLGKKIPKYSFYHITSQHLSFLKLYPRIITVLDIIHYAFPETRMHFFLSKYILYKGLLNFENSFFISISNHAKHDLIRYFNIPSEKIKVIYLGVDRSMYKPLKDNDIVHILEKHNLRLVREETYTLLYVGSDHPRKNLLRLIQAIYELKRKYNVENIRLIKVGAEQHKHRKRVIDLINKLNLMETVIFLDSVPETDLPALYNAADLFVYPSLYEGFGLPPLEAMACGTPVITSNTSSLPEVVGDAGIMVDPYDIDGLAKAMYEVLTNEGLREDLRKRGLERAKLFSWKKCAEETLKVYEEVYSMR